MRAQLVIVAALLAAAHGDANANSADGIPSKARALADKGRAAHDQGDYASAIAAFKEAYVIAPAAALLFNLAQAYRLQGNCDDASMMYHRYLGTNPSAEGRVLAEGHLATVERCMHKRSLNIPMDESMSYLQVPTPPPDLGVIDTPAKPASASTKKELGAGLAIGGAAAIAVATYYGFRAHAAAQDVERAYAEGAKWKDVAARHADGERAATIAKLSGIGGGVALAAGVTLYVLGRRAERAPPIAITPTASGARVSLAWRF